ncbi:hypothetical protein RU96_GL000116 [Enterococcus canintestini]|uniref:Uncharacterized protein n=1 Tax=Enterococcus canintestini TaxID=317010 RepID=A0A1L8RA73_9ENTE|nr:hypothetical protein RU96_GL000116 [Enterococcus canintestini]
MLILCIGQIYIAANTKNFFMVAMIILSQSFLFCGLFAIMNKEMQKKEGI